MKLAQTNRALETGGMNLNVNFSIKMNGKSFRVLSGGVYSDQIGSIVRELSSNCYDSHVAAGKADLPFEVSCPNAFDPFFSVKDFGTGLRYFAYDAKVVCELEGESTLFIKGDIRSDIRNISMMVIDENQTVPVSTVLYDNTSKETIFRVPMTLTDGSTIKVEFDDALVLYSTYFDSTKEASNDYIGAFGLGSKTPLAYTDNFLVINRYNGIERSYNIFINESDVPQINLMGSGVTDECNGLEVKLAVEPSEHEKFKNAIKTQLKFFNPAPTICNEKVSMPAIIATGKYFILWDNPNPNGWGSKYNAVIGNNAYTFDGNIAHVSNVFRRNVAIKLPIGSVMVTASRESMKACPETSAVVEKYAKLAMKEYSKYILDSIDTTNMNSVEKATFLNENSDGIDLSLPEVRELVGNPYFIYHSNQIEVDVMSWCGASTALRFAFSAERDINGELVLDADGKPLMTERRVSGGTSKYPVQWFDYSYNNRTRACTDLMIKPNQKLFIFVRDNDYAFLKKIEYHLSSGDVSVDANTRIMIVRPNDITDSIDALKDTIAELGVSAEYANLSDIVLPKSSTASTYVSNTPITRIWKAGDNLDYLSPGYIDYWTDNFTETLTKIDTSGNNVYAVSSYRSEYDNISNMDINFLKLAISEKLYTDDFIIHAVPRAKYEKFISYGGKPISELFDKVRKAISIPVEYADYKLCEEINAVINESKFSTLISHIHEPDFSGLSRRSGFAVMIRAQRIAAKYADKFSGNYAVYAKMIADGAVMPEPSKNLKKMLDLTKKVCDNLDSDPNFKVLTLIRLLNSDSLKIVVDFINANTGEKGE